VWTTPQVSDDLVLRLSAIARELEGEGQLNLAKLFRAAAEGEIHQQTQSRPRLGNGLDTEMQSVVDDFSAHGMSSGPLIGALTQAVEMLKRGESPLMEDIPNPYVCCHCGYVSIGLPPGPCPTCEARPYSFKEIPPIFFLQQPFEASEVAVLLQENLRDIEESVAGVDETASDNGVWPMREIMAHLFGAQLIMFNRAQRMLSEDNPDLGSIPRSEIDAIYGEASRPIAEMLESYQTTRYELLG
jgi:hypothetical protein